MSLALALTRPAPQDAQSVEDNRVANAQFAGVGDDLVGVINCAVDGDAPGFVADDAVAVLTCGLSSVTVTMKDGPSTIV